MQGVHKDAGYDSTRVLRILSLILILPIAIATLLAIPMRTSITDKQIQQTSYGHFSPQRYPLSHATRLINVHGFETEGKYHERPFILMDFDPEGRWSSSFSGDSVSLDPNLLEFLQTKTGLPIEHHATEQDIPHTSH